MTYDELRAKAESLKEGDLDGLKALIADMLASGAIHIECEALLKMAAKACKIGITLVRRWFDEIKAAAERAKQRSPEAREEERRQREAAAEAARIVRKAERDRLSRLCRDLALAPNLMTRMADTARRLGVVGERAAVACAYLAMTSRLLKDNAISLLRRGAPAGGKNFLINSITRLIPSESVISISSASPMALIYYGDDEDALKHKVIVIAEAAAIAQKNNGDEHPMAVMLRTLLSEGGIDREVAIPQRNDVPKTVHVRRNGPVSVMLTSARENVDQEMLTRLMISDADESRKQTIAVVNRTLVGVSPPATKEEIEEWLDLQRWLEADAPYDVTVPFAAAISAAYKQLSETLPAALQLRMRRDITGLVTAIKASAVLHQAQRKTDESGRIVAEFADYRHAWNAFNQSVASLYGTKVRPEVIAVVEAAAKLGAKKQVSVKLPVAALCKELGTRSHDVAWNRLREAVECGALEEDDERRGAGRGRPRYYWLRKTAAELRDAPSQPVFPPPDRVQKIFQERQGLESDGQNGQEEPGEPPTPASCPSCPSYPSVLDPCPPITKFTSPKADADADATDGASRTADPAPPASDFDDDDADGVAI